MNNKTVLIYYIYVLTLIVLTGYVVFILDYSGWWFLLTILLMEVAPKSKGNDKE